MTSALSVVEPKSEPVTPQPLSPGVLEQLPAIVWTVDRALRLTSRSGAGLAALSQEIRTHDTDLFGFLGTRDPDFPPIAAHLRALDGENAAYEMAWGGRTFACHVAPLREGAAITGAAGVALDISERKSHEAELAQARDDAETAVERLRQSEERSRALLASLPQRIFFKDADGVFVQVNELFAADLGLTPQDLEGKSDSDFFPQELAEKYRADDLRILRADVTETLVETNISGGTRRWVEVVKKPVFSEEGEPLGILGVFTDITERKRMEDEIAHERYLLRTLMDNIPDLIYFKDRDSRFTLINRAQAATLGVADPADALGKCDHDFFPKELADGFRADEQRIMETGEPLLSKTEVIESALHGGQRWLSAIKMPIFQDGEIIGIVGVSRDITERVWADLELKKAAEELSRSNEDLQQFAYVASHDLQEPLRMVASYTQLLQRRYRGRLDADADEFIQFAVDGATRMQGLINDLLQYSRVGTRGAAFEPMKLDAAVDRATANLKTLIEETGARLVREPLPVVEADPSQMAQLMQNLIGNAIKFRGERTPEVHISAEQSGDEWVISVRDNGIGIDPQYAERIFIIFQRLHTKAEYPGSGIGLSICKKIVNRHGGRVWVEPATGGGSVFRFTLPVRREGNGGVSE